MNTGQLHKMESTAGFIAALDQSGGSTPKALMAYGLDKTTYADEAQMFDLMHQMRSRIMTSPAFTGERILGAILFEMTMERQVAGKGAAEYLWEDKHVVPFVKVDKGLAEEIDGVRLMKPMPSLDDLLARAKTHGVFGTKTRSVVLRADEAGIDANVSQQFEIGLRILDAGLMPIIEPEVDIHSPQKAEAEAMVTAAITAQLDRLAGDQRVMLKLTLPDQDGLYGDLVQHPRVLHEIAVEAVLVGQGQFEHHPLVAGEPVELRRDRGRHHRLRLGLLRAVDVHLRLDDRHEPCVEDPQPDLELLAHVGIDARLVSPQDDGARLGAEHPVGLRSGKEVVQTGHRLHQPHAVDLLRQPLVDLHERDDVLVLPQVLGGALAGDLALHGHLEQDRAEDPLTREGRARHDPAAHLVHEVEHLRLVRVRGLVEPISHQRLGSAAAALVQRGDEACRALHLVQLSGIHS